MPEQVSVFLRKADGSAATLQPEQRRHEGKAEGAGSGAAALAHLGCEIVMSSGSIFAYRCLSTSSLI